MENGSEIRVYRVNLIEYPSAPFLCESESAWKYIIIDGLQRTDTLQSFVRKDGFKLQNLRVLRKLNGLGFEALDDRLRAGIEDRQLLLYVIKPSVSIAMVYDIFNRINTGGTPLNRQEIRNCLFIGKATRLLKDLSEKDCFRRATGNGISPKRMKDREAVLRYLAFRLSDYEKDYKNDMDAFLGNALKKINIMQDSEISDLEQDFERVMKLTHDFFGNGNFRMPPSNTGSRINVAILESVSLFFSTKSDEFLRKNETAIKENYKTLLKNPDFIDAVTISAWDKKKVVSRFKLVQEILGDV